MAFTQPTYATNNIDALSFRPNAIEGYTGDQLQQAFDKVGVDTKAFLIAFIAELENATSGSEGAASIGAYYNAAETTVQAALVSVKSDINTVQTNVDVVQTNVDAVQANLDAVTAAQVSFDNTVGIPFSPVTVQEAIEYAVTLTGVSGIQALIDTYNKRVARGGAPY